MTVELSVVVPAYNEADKIENTINTIGSYLQKFESYEVVVVSDGSTDDTGAVVTSLAAADPRVRLMELRPNRGKGWAVRTGMLAANGEIVIFSDADLSVPFEELDKLLAALEQGADIAIASRGLRESHFGRRQGRPCIPRNSAQREIRPGPRALCPSPARAAA